jgi:hypothetical protein
MREYNAYLAELADKDSASTDRADQDRTPR